MIYIIQLHNGTYIPRIHLVNQNYSYVFVNTSCLHIILISHGMFNEFSIFLITLMNNTIYVLKSQ